MQINSLLWGSKGSPSLLKNLRTHTVNLQDLLLKTDFIAKNTFWIWLIEKVLPTKFAYVVKYVEPSSKKILYLKVSELAQAAGVSEKKIRHKSEKIIQKNVRVQEAIQDYLIELSQESLTAKIARKAEELFKQQDDSILAIRLYQRKNPYLCLRGWEKITVLEVTSEILGKGGFSQVHKINTLVNPLSKELVLKRGLEESDQNNQDIIQEGYLLSQIDHPAFISAPLAIRKWDWFSKGGRVISLQFKFEKTLYDSRSQIPFTQEKLLEEFAKLAEGLEYLHARGRCHGDIKPQNIAIVDNCLKFIDLGTSRKISDKTLSAFSQGYTPHRLVERGFNAKLSEQDNRTQDIYALMISLMIAFSFLQTPLPKEIATFIQKWGIKIEKGPNLFDKWKKALTKKDVKLPSARDLQILFTKCVHHPIK